MRAEYTVRMEEGMKEVQRRWMLAFMMSVLLMMNACATTNTKQFGFYVPKAEHWQDREVKNITADDGIKLAYREEGDIHCSKAFILVPGSTMYGYYYVPFMDKLASDKLYVRTIDLRGHGDSEGPRGDVPDEFSLIKDLHAHITQILSINPQVKIIISGHSMGAGICGKYLEKYGYDSVAGAVYLAPFFHWRQPGMKSVKYVDVDMFKTIFGDDHGVTQVYHPTSDDLKLVRKYTKMMSKASMVTDYSSFRSNHTTHSLYLIGKKDELFDWEESPSIFKNQSNMELAVIEEATHLDILERCPDEILQWLDSL
jgi:pimeloyl-ACP methyl ester carboxylesterase